MANAKASGKDAEPKASKVGAITPPPLTRGRKGHKVEPEIVAGMVETLATGDWAIVTDDSDNPIPFKVDDPGDDKAHRRARHRANTAAVRHKKAILNDPNNDHDDPDAITTRVWENESGVYVFAVGLKPADDE